MTTSPASRHSMARHLLVDDGGQHPHLVALDAVEALHGPLQSAEDVASANDDAHLYAHVAYFLDLFGVLHQPLFVEDARLVSFQALAAELEEDAFVSCCHILLKYSWFLH